MPNSVSGWSNSCLPDGARAREAKSRSVNSFPLSVSILAILTAQTRLQIGQELTGVRGGLGWHDAHEDPPRGVADGDEQVAAVGPNRHLWQVFDVDVQETQLMGPERLVRLGQGSGPQGTEIAHPFAIVLESMAQMAHRRKQRSRPESDTSGLRNSRVTP